MRTSWLHLVLLSSSLHLAAHAADVLPAHLVGVWGTGASLHEGTEPQTELHLLANGFGIIAGSTSAPRRADHIDDGTPAPRGIVGFPTVATWDGDMLSIRPLLPPGAEKFKSGDAAIVCHHELVGPKLSCKGPDGKPMMLVRRSESVPQETVQTIEEFRNQMR